MRARIRHDSFFNDSGRFLAASCVKPKTSLRGSAKLRLRNPELIAFNRLTGSTGKNATQSAHFGLTDRFIESFASSSQGFISTFAGMEVALDTDNDRKIGMPENLMKFDFQLSHKTLAAL